mgnify:CR=1 FL=1
MLAGNRALRHFSSDETLRYVLQHFTATINVETTGSTDVATFMLGINEMKWNSETRVYGRHAPKRFTSISSIPTLDATTVGAGEGRCRP